MPRTALQAAVRSHESPISDLYKVHQIPPNRPIHQPRPFGPAQSTNQRRHFLLHSRLLILPTQSLYPLLAQLIRSFFQPICSFLQLIRPFPQIVKYISTLSLEPGRCIRFIWFLTRRARSARMTRTCTSAMCGGFGISG
jgi:hypothetical protein